MWKKSNTEQDWWENEQQQPWKKGFNKILKELIGIRTEVSKIQPKNGMKKNQSYFFYYEVGMDKGFLKIVFMTEMEQTKGVEEPKNGTWIASRRY